MVHAQWDEPLANSVFDKPGHQKAISDDALQSVGGGTSTCSEDGGGEDEGRWNVVRRNARKKAPTSHKY